MLTYAQQKSVISKYIVSRHTVTNTAGNYQYYCRYNCRYCHEKGASLEKLGHILEVEGSRLWAIWTTIDAKDEYTSETLKKIQVLADHLEKEHEVSPCKVCGDMVTRRGLTRHQSAPRCTAELRRYTMRNKGFEQLSEGIAFMIPSYIKHQRNKLERLVPWDDEDALNLVASEATKAENFFISNLGIKTCLTMWDPKEKEYKKEFWAPPHVARVLELHHAVTPWRAKPEERAEPLINLINQWLDADDTMQDAIIGLLELQKEGIDNA